MWPFVPGGGIRLSQNIFVRQPQPDQTTQPVQGAQLLQGAQPAHGARLQGAQPAHGAQLLQGAYPLQGVDLSLRALVVQSVAPQQPSVRPANPLTNEELHELRATRGSIISTLYNGRFGELFEVSLEFDKEPVHLQVSAEQTQTTHTATQTPSSGSAATHTQTRDSVASPQATATNPQATATNPQATVTNSQATAPNPPVTATNLQVTAIYPQATAACPQATVTYTLDTATNSQDTMTYAQDTMIYLQDPATYSQLQQATATYLQPSHDTMTYQQITATSIQPSGNTATYLPQAMAIYTQAAATYHPQPPEATATYHPQPPEATATYHPQPPEATATYHPQPPEATATYHPQPPEATATYHPQPPEATATYHPQPPEATATYHPQPPEATATYHPQPPEATATYHPQPPEATATYHPQPPEATATYHPQPPGATATYPQPAPPPSAQFSGQPADGQSFMSTPASTAEQSDSPFFDGYVTSANAVIPLEADLEDYTSEGNMPTTSTVHFGDLSHRPQSSAGLNIPTAGQLSGQPTAGQQCESLIHNVEGSGNVDEPDASSMSHQARDRRQGSAPSVLAQRPNVAQWAAANAGSIDAQHLSTADTVSQPRTGTPVVRGHNAGNAHVSDGQSGQQAAFPGRTNRIGNLPVPGVGALGTALCASGRGFQQDVVRSKDVADGGHSLLSEVDFVARIPTPPPLEDVGQLVEASGAYVLRHGRFPDLEENGGQGQDGPGHVVTSARPTRPAASVQPTHQAQPNPDTSISVSSTLRADAFEFVPSWLRTDGRNPGSNLPLDSNASNFPSCQVMASRTPDQFASASPTSSAGTGHLSLLPMDEFGRSVMDEGQPDIMQQQGVSFEQLDLVNPVQADQPMISLLQLGGVQPTAFETASSTDFNPPFSTQALFPHNPVRVIAQPVWDQSVGWTVTNQVPVHSHGSGGRGLKIKAKSCWGRKDVVVRRVRKSYRTSQQLKALRVLRSLHHRRPTEFISHLILDFMLHKTCYLVFERHPLGSLADVMVHRHDSLPEEVNANALREMTEALQCLHENRILHRYICPGSWLVAGRGHLKLSEFNQAKCFTTDDQSADWFSMGVIMLELLGNRGAGVFETHDRSGCDLDFIISDEALASANQKIQAWYGAWTTFVTKRPRSEALWMTIVALCEVEADNRPTPAAILRDMPRVFSGGLQRKPTFSPGWDGQPPVIPRSPEPMVIDQDHGGSGGGSGFGGNYSGDGGSSGGGAGGHSDLGGQGHGHGSGWQALRVPVDGQDQGFRGVHHCSVDSPTRVEGQDHDGQDQGFRGVHHCSVDSPTRGVEGQDHDSRGQGEDQDLGVIDRQGDATRRCQGLGGEGRGDRDRRGQASSGRDQGHSQGHTLRHSGAEKVRVRKEDAAHHAGEEDGNQTCDVRPSVTDKTGVISSSLTDKTGVISSSLTDKTGVISSSLTDKTGVISSSLTDKTSVIRPDSTQRRSENTPNQMDVTGERTDGMQRPGSLHSQSADDAPTDGTRSLLPGDGIAYIRNKENKTFAAACRQSCDRISGGDTRQRADRAAQHCPSDVRTDPLWLTGWSAVQAKGAQGCSVLDTLLKLLWYRQDRSVLAL